MITNSGIKFELEDEYNSMESMAELMYYLDDETNMVYVSHPYGGKVENIESLGNKLKLISKEFPYINLISPIHNLSYLEYSDETYDEDLNKCIRLLGMCDYMFIIGDWKSSKGCMSEYIYCKENHIPIVFVDFINTEVTHD